MENSLRKIINKNEKIIGTIASVLAIIMFISLIEIFNSNLQGNSHIFIQPLVTAINCFFWSLYAYGRKDWFLLAPNLSGLVLGIATAVSAFV